jgi:hypothetical protein
MNEAGRPWGVVDLFSFFKSLFCGEDSFFAAFAGDVLRVLASF